MLSMIRSNLKPRRVFFLKKPIIPYLKLGAGEIVVRLCDSSKSIAPTHSIRTPSVVRKIDMPVL